MNRIGIDLGGTKIEGILTDENYKSITRKRIPTNQEEGYNSILESIKNLVLELIQESNDKVSIGVCTPGALSLSSGLIKNSNTQCLIGKDLQNDLKNILHYNISIENKAITVINLLLKNVNVLRRKDKLEEDRKLKTNNFIITLYLMVGILVVVYLKIANMRAIAVRAFSPPDNN